LKIIVAQHTPKNENPMRLQHLQTKRTRIARNIMYHNEQLNSNKGSSQRFYLQGEASPSLSALRILETAKSG
jgi:hypothetical protein